MAERQWVALSLQYDSIYDKRTGEISVPESTAVVRIFIDLPKATFNVRKAVNMHVRAVELFMFRVYSLSRHSLVKWANQVYPVRFKWRVIGMFKCNKSQRKIASVLNVSKTCVAKTIAKYRESGEVHDRRRSGRPKATSLMDDRVLARLTKQNWNASVPLLRTRLQEVCGKNVSVMTVSRQLRTQGLRSYMTAAVQRRGPLRTLFTPPYPCLPYTHREKFLPECLSSVVQQGGGSIIAWGCISMQGTGFIRFTGGYMDSKEYIETMKDTMLPSAHKLHGVTENLYRTNAIK
ncbi:hypothetical protein PR048_006128, partial [Dryococelus australis]